MRRIGSKPVPSTGAVNSPVQAVIFAVLIGLVIVLAYRQFMRIAGAKRSVVVAASSLAKGTVLEDAHLKLVSMREGAVPDAALFRLSDAAGLQLIHARGANEPILAAHVKDSVIERTRSLAELIPEGRVLTTVKLRNATFPHRDLKRGDRIDVLIAGTTSSRTRAAKVVARDVFFLGYMTPRKPRAPRGRGLLGLDIAGQTSQKPQHVALLVALKPGDVVPLAAIDGAGAAISLVLHSDDEVKSGELLAVEGAPLPTTVEVISGTVREDVVVD